ncbi:MAG: hypothetical protein HC802_17345 [Caldilineaceae bacterium]|nr:hypothetical protein [Caldilineaceae bacterium]
MPELPFPDGFDLAAYHADWRDLALAIPAAILVTLLIIWWRQQTRYWFRIVMASLLAALVLCIASIYLFVVPAYYAGCPEGCLGWSGYPLPVSVVDFAGEFALALSILSSTC